MKITNKKRNILLISVITCLVLCLGITSVSIYTEAKAIEADLSKYGITAEEINDAYKNGITLNDKAGLLMYFCENDTDTAISFAEILAYQERARMKQSKIPDVVYYKLYDEINYSKEYLEELESDNAKDNYLSCYTAARAYITLARTYGKEYFRTSIIVSDDKLELEYFKKAAELLVKRAKGEIESEQSAYLSPYMYYRSKHLTDPEVIKYYKEELEPIVLNDFLIDLNLLDPENFPLDFNPYTEYSNITYARDEDGNVYNIAYETMLKRFGYKPGVKVD